MINTFQVIGKAILKKNGYYETNNEIEKRKKLLFHQSLIPREKRDKHGNRILDGKALCLNFALKKNKFEFILSDKELIEENRSFFYAFKLGAPKDKKKFLSTNNFSTFLSVTFLDTQEYLKDKLNNKKANRWINENITKEYEHFMDMIFKRFYIIEGKEIYLNYNLLIKEQNLLFSQIKDQFPLNKKNELYFRFLNKWFFKTESKNIKNMPMISMVLFEGQRILDYENKKYHNDYINLCYYDLLNRFIVEKGIEKKLCHICKKEKTVVKDLPFAMKFYGSTNALNFEYLKNKNAYKSFAVCKDCLPEIITGMKYIQNTFSEYLFDLNLYIIPAGIYDNTGYNSNLYKRIIRILKINRSIYKNEIELLKQVLRSSFKKNIKFNLMFYHHPAGSQQFDILKLISNIELNKLLPKLELLDEMSKYYLLDLIGDGRNTLTLNSLRYSLFPSYLSHKNPEYSVFAKDLVNFLESLLNDSKINYNSLINKFITIYKKRINNKKADVLAAFKLNLFISILYKLNLLKGGNSVNEEQFVSEVIKKEYQEFFNVHSAVYANSAYRQGLFLLGTIISKIMYMQKDKSSSFLKKLNFDGIAVRRIPSLVNQVKQFEDIYRKKIFQEKGVWGCIMDRLQGIETSSLKPDEVVFYILSGIAFDDYLGMRKAMEKKLNQNQIKGE